MASHPWPPMSNLFFNLGRTVGYATLPAIRKSKWVWKSLTGTDAEAVRAEGEFGKSLAAELRLKVGTSNHAEDLNLVRSILQRLSRCVRNKERQFKADVLLEAAPGAMALPGGFIFLNAGLLEFCQRNPDELAFVIGHEMGHIIRGHALERMLKRIGAEGVSAVLSRGLLNPVLRESGVKWLERSHSREAEMEADEFAVRVAMAARYDPAGAVRLLEKLAKRKEAQSDVGEYFASHPPEADRIASVKAVSTR